MLWEDWLGEICRQLSWPASWVLGHTFAQIMALSRGKDGGKVETHNPDDPQFWAEVQRWNEQQQSGGAFVEAEKWFLSRRW